MALDDFVESEAAIAVAAMALLVSVAACTCGEIKFHKAREIPSEYIHPGSILSLLHHPRTFLCHSNVLSEGRVTVELSDEVDEAHYVRVQLAAKDDNRPRIALLGIFIACVYILKRCAVAPSWVPWETAPSTPRTARSARFRRLPARTDTVLRISSRLNLVVSSTSAAKRYIFSERQRVCPRTLSPQAQATEVERVEGILCRSRRKRKRSKRPDR